jgi:hypothetical protein
MAEITVTQVAVIFVRIFKNPVMIRMTVSSSRRGIHNPTMPVRITVTPTGLTSTHKMKFLRPLQVKKELAKTFGFVIVELVGTTVCQ